MKKIFLGFVIILILSTVILPKHNPKKTDMNNIFAPASKAHILGTDHLGRDIFSLIYSGFIRTITVLAAASSISFICGTVVGILGGYYGGIFDLIVKIITGIFLIIPSFIAALIASAAFGLNPISAGIAIGIADIGTYANQTAILTRSFKTEEFIFAEKILGIPDKRIIFYHILPNIIPHLFTTLSTKAGAITLQYASLTFIGLGADITNPDWGAILYTYRIFIINKPALLLWPSFAIFILAALFYFTFDSKNILK